ncbi:MAG: LysM domain-containing protein [Paraglaciecola sp.]|uniref:LysM peptidoglycan-binding domain-containing protein n=1 Tax=Paraglaciecola sp. TaxID=1920173 RepID=UPI003298ED9A
MISCMDNKIKLSAAILVAGLILSGCGGTGGGTAGKTTSAEVNKTKGVQNNKTYIAEVGLTPRQRFSKALEKLENGEDGQALAELNAYLEAVPRSNSARNLVAQISTDSSQYFPAEYFKVNLTSGTSLSTLAKKYLGSALKFYALAKYNNIANPSRVNIGQEIKIPMTQLARAQRDKDASQELEVPSADSEDASVELAMQEEINEVNESAEAAEDLVESSEIPVEEPVLAEVVPIAPVETAESALSDLKELAQNMDYQAAIEKLATLSTFGKLNSESRDLAISTYIGRAKEIAETDNVLAATYFEKAGQLNLQKEEPFNAFENFKMATELDGQNDLAMEEMLVLQKEIADKYHREASSAFRRQELDLAIEKWDMVLKVNPDHSSAKLYRAQALELQEKLDNLNRN